MNTFARTDVPLQTMFRCKNDLHMDLFLFLEQIDQVPAFAVHAGVIHHQPDLQPLKQVETGAFEDIQPG